MPEPVLVLAPLPESLLKRLEGRFELIDAWEDPLGVLDACPETQRIEVAFTIGNRPLKAEVIERLPSLRYVCHYGVGHDQIDLDALHRRGVVITNTAGSNSSCVADMAMALLVTCVRRVRAGDDYVRSGAWARNGRMQDATPGMGGRKLGLYGLGGIGRKVAIRAAAFEMEVGYHATAAKPDVGYRFFPTLGGLADWADDLVIAVNATPVTKRSVDGEILRRLGKDGVVVNVSRGSVVDEPDLIAALQTASIAGAGLDVFASEPANPEMLQGFANVVLSPHAGANTHRAWRQTDDVFLENLDRHCRGLRPLNAIRR